MDKIEGGGSFSVDAKTGAVTANHLDETQYFLEDVPAPADKSPSATVTPITAAKE
jgi:hypothetical protein